MYIHYNLIDYAYNGMERKDEQVPFKSSSDTCPPNLNRGSAVNDVSSCVSGMNKLIKTNQNRLGKRTLEHTLM